MVIAIHSNPLSFSNQWIKYCQERNIAFKIVNCYSTNIVHDLCDCDALMWHFHHANNKDVKFAKQLLYSIQTSGKVTFPDFNSVWHFDDKVGQKYLFEAIDAPLVPTYVFFSKRDALQWAKSTKFPKVFKLRRGAGSGNVRLVKTKKQGIRIIRKAFSSGFDLFNSWGGLKERWRKYRIGKSSFLEVIKGIGRLFIRTPFEKTEGREKGYVYFQDYIKDCEYDIRVKVIDNKCWAFKRIVRENDFRASGSGIHNYNYKDIPTKVIEIAFEVSRRLKLKCVAFDFILADYSKPMLVEMSYGFGYTENQFFGYWDSDLIRHEEKFNPFGWMVESLINDIRNNI